ncbi:MAG: sulfatase [Planctomycetes bacterium]|nr:sulfatase [Planctomycetota bacterium]
MKRALAAASLVALACVAALALRERAAPWRTPLRLLECALATPAALQFRADAAELPPRATQRFPFKGGRSGWLELDPAGTPVEPRRAGRTLAHEGADGVGALRFPDASGGVARALPIGAQRLLRVVATVRRGATTRGDATSGRGATRLYVQPTLRPLDLEQELATRSYLDLAVDPSVLLGEEPLLGSAAAPTDGMRHELAVTLVTPAGTRGLTLLFAAGDGSADGTVDLEEVRIEEVPLREWLALEASAGGAAGGAPLDAATSPTATERDRAARELGVLAPPLATLPALRKVEHLLEQRDALLLPPPAQATLEVELPAGSWRLEYGVARLHEARKNLGRAALEVELRVEPRDGASTQQRTALAAQSIGGWIDRSIDLVDHRGGAVRFTFTSRAKGMTADLVAIGAPLVRPLRARDDRWNVVLVSLDTVRADHLSAHGYPRPTTPHLDAFARDAAWFRAASSTSSYTLPAHASLFTGQLPSRHGAHSESPGRNRLWSDRSDLLAARFRAGGWLTAAFTGGVYLRASFGFDQGFDRYDSSDLALPLDAPRARELPRLGEPEWNAAWRSTRTWDHALDWIRGHADAPFFLFLHTYLAHEYLAAPENEARFLGSTQSALPRGDLKFIRDRTLREAPAPGDLQRYVDAYDAALREADGHVGALLALLDELALAERTIVLIVSDHGEEFLDHGGVNHGRTLHEEMVHVPFLMRVPGTAPQEITLPVSLLDVAPTLAELCGLAGDRPHDGRSLVTLLHGGTLPPTPIEAELDLVRENRWFLRRVGDEKALEVRDERSARQAERDGRPRAAPRRMSFAVGHDPHETRDLAHGTPDEEARAAELFDALEAQREEARARREEARRRGSEAGSSADRFDVGELGGYVERGSDEDDEEEGAARDDATGDGG